MVKFYRFVFLFFVLISLFDCRTTTKEKRDVGIYKIPPIERNDSLITWFSTQENFNSDEFIPKFHENFAKLQSANNWEKAAELLFYAGESMYVNRKSEAIMINTYTQFLQQHKSDISDIFRSGLMLNLGILYYYNSNIDSSISLLTKTTQIPHHDYHTLVNISTAHNELAYNYTELGKLDKALFSTFQALDGYTKLSDTLGMGGAYDAISKVYIALEDYNNAEKYIDKAVEILRSGLYFSSIFEVYAGKLELYQLTDNPKLYPFVDTLYSFYEKQDFQNDFYKITAYGWKASKYLEEKNTKEAGKLIAETLPIFDSSKEKFLFGKYIETVSKYEKLMGRQVIDSKVYRNGLVEYKSSKNIIGQLACYGGLIDEALRVNDYKNAYLYSQEFNHLEDSLSSKSLIIKTKELDRKYQTEKKEQQIILQKTELTQKNAYIALLVAILGGILITAFALYLWNRQKKLKQEKENTMNFTKQLLQSTEEERKRIAGDLHDSISHELLNLKSIFTQDISVVNSKIDTIINDIRGISRNLHPVMFDKIGLIPNVEQLLERVQNQSNFFVSTELKYLGFLTSEDELQIYRIIQEALTNIIKYAKAHAAKISIIEEPNQLHIEIKDNGGGFNVKDTLKSQKAFGLHNIIERSRIIGGITDISSTNEGTIVSVKIDKKS